MQLVTRVSGALRIARSILSPKESVWSEIVKPDNGSRIFSIQSAERAVAERGYELPTAPELMQFLLGDQYRLCSRERQTRQALLDGAYVVFTRTAWTLSENQILQYDKNVPLWNVGQNVFSWCTDGPPLPDRAYGLHEHDTRTGRVPVNHYLSNGDAERFTEHTLGGQNMGALGRRVTLQLPGMRFRPFPVAFGTGNNTLGAILYANAAIGVKRL